MVYQPTYPSHNNDKGRTAEHVVLPRLRLDHCRHRRAADKGHPPLVGGGGRGCLRISKEWVRGFGCTWWWWKKPSRSTYRYTCYLYHKHPSTHPPSECAADVTDDGRESDGRSCNGGGGGVGCWMGIGGLITPPLRCDGSMVARWLGFGLWLVGLKGDGSIFERAIEKGIRSSPKVMNCSTRDRADRSSAVRLRLKG